jgi:hypothetical protein
LERDKAASFGGVGVVDNFLFILNSNPMNKKIICQRTRNLYINVNSRGLNKLTADILS